MRGFFPAGLWGPGALALVLGLALCACATDVAVDPEGYRCDAADLCPSGYDCVAGTCRASGSDLCAGVRCEEVPQNTCKDADTLLSWNGGGTCEPSTGACHYPSTEVTCAQGCEGGACRGEDLCQHVSCSQPPAPACAGPNVLHTWDAVGTCESSTGQCSYASSFANCPNGCADGVCLAPGSKSFARVGPRIPQAVTAVDVAPSSSGNHVLAVGKGGFVTKWDGTSWHPLSSGTTRELLSVWLRSGTQGYVVGKGGSALLYDGEGLSPLVLPGAGSGVDLVSVHGNGSHVIVAAADGTVWRSTDGTSFTRAPAPPAGYGYQLVQAFVDRDDSERVVGLCTGTLARPCVLYAGGAGATAWYVDEPDLGSLLSTGFTAVGPSTDTGYAFVAQDEGIYRHDSDTGDIDSNDVPTGISGSRVTGITLDVNASVEAVFLLSSGDQSAFGKLYRWQRGGSLTPLLTLYGSSQAVSRNDAGGVVVADSGAQGANVFRRGPVTDEALELNEDWADADLAPDGARVLINGYGDLAVLPAAGGAYRFDRSPATSPDYVGVVAGQGYALEYGKSGKLYRWTPAGGHLAVLGAGSTDWKAGCRNSDSEMFLVGAGGKIARYDGSALTLMSTATSAALNAVTCAGAGKAFAVGANGTVLRLSNGSWTGIGGVPSGAELRGAYATSQGELFVAGDVLWKYAGGAWSALNGKAGVSQLYGFGSAELYGVAGSGVFRFNGSAWTNAFGAPGTVAGGGASATALVLAGPGGLVVEAR